MFLLQKMDIEVADLKKKVSGSQIHLPNEHSGSANNCIKNKHQNTAADTYNTYDETGSMINGNKEGIIEAKNVTSSLFKTVPLIKNPSAAKQIRGQKKEKVEGGGKYRSTMESRTNTKRNETRKQLNKPAGSKQERLKTFKKKLSEQLHISKPLKSDNIKNDQNTKINVASESLNLDEKKESKPSMSIKNGKIRPQSRAKRKSLEEPKTPSAKSRRCKRLLKRKIPARRIIKKTLLEPNIMIQNEVELAKTDKSTEENFCVTETQRYENDLKTVDVKVDLPQKAGQVKIEDNTRKHDLDINIPIQNMSQIVSDEMKVQVTGSDSNGAMHIQRQETETFVCKNVSKRKRYMRLHRILSSALGYSWSYKEVPRKMKLSKLDSREINIAPKVFMVELKQGKFLVSETCDNFARHDGEITAPLSKIKLGIHDTDDTRSEKITIKKKRIKQRRFKATRIFPKSCPGMTDSSVTPEKAKAHKIKRCHWTHSKF